MDSVIFKELTCKNKKIGVAQLNNPKALNALNVTMIDMLHAQLKLWESDENIASVLLEGNGDKAFCAGGDVVGLYHEIIKLESNAQSDDKITNSLCAEFFEKEYDLDLYIHEYSKPIIVWGHGYVFGGGMGLFAGASHRITTEKTIMAMPETAIGLYPEVGASWFLNKMPNNIGLFLGITGAFFNASDAKYVGLSNFNIASQFKDGLVEQLCQIRWGVNPTQQIDSLLAGIEQKSLSYMPDSTLELLSTDINNLIEGKSIQSIYENIIQTSFEHKWLLDAQAKLNNASVLSVVLTYEQLIKTKHMPKAECFNEELNLSLRCCQFSEFPEGVRAQLVDKDKKPRWAFNKIEEVEPELVSWFFSSIKSKN